MVVILTARECCYRMTSTITYHTWSRIMIMIITSLTRTPLHTCAIKFWNKFPIAPQTYHNTTTPHDAMPLPSHQTSNIVTFVTPKHDDVDSYRPSHTRRLSVALHFNIPFMCVLQRLWSYLIHVDHYSGREFFARFIFSFCMFHHREHVDGPYMPCTYTSSCSTLPHTMWGYCLLIIHQI